MTVLVTGGSGFIGQRLVARLEDVLAPRLDLTQPLSGLPERIDAVVHLAQSRRYREFPEGARDMVAVNVTAVANLAEYARRAGAKTFVLASTGGVYGSRPGTLYEDDPVAPAGFYAATRYAAEVLLAPYAECFTPVILRPFFVYGPGQRGMLVAGLAERVLAGEEITVPGDAGPRLTPLYVDDAVRAVAAALTLGERATINLAGDEAVTVADIARGLAAAAGVEARITGTGGPVLDMLPDNSRMKALLGVTPEVPLAEGLQNVIAALRG